MGECGDNITVNETAIAATPASYQNHHMATLLTPRPRDQPRCRLCHNLLGGVPYLLLICRAGIPIRWVSVCSECDDDLTAGIPAASILREFRAFMPGQ